MYCGAFIFCPENSLVMVFSALIQRILMNPLTEFFRSHMIRPVPQDFDLGL